MRCKTCAIHCYMYVIAAINVPKAVTWSDCRLKGEGYWIFQKRAPSYWNQILLRGGRKSGAESEEYKEQVQKDEDYRRKEEHGRASLEIESKYVSLFIIILVPQPKSGLHTPQLRYQRFYKLGCGR